MKCPLCNGQSFFEWGKVDQYSIMRCESCGLGITTPFPTREQLEESNASIYSVEQRIKIYLLRQHYFEKRYNAYLARIKAFKPTGKLLDIGCNIGLFLKQARQNGFESTGVELNNECAKYGRTHFKLTIYSEYLESIKFDDETFDVITLFDIIEHIPDIDSFMAQIKRILKHDGLLVVQSPNIDSVMSHLTKSKWNWLTPPDHLYHFSPKNLLRFIESRGFEICSLKTWEPFEDFLCNMITVYISSGIFGKALAKFFIKFRFFLVPFFWIQKRWWSKQKGALIEIYAMNSQKTC